MKVPPTTIISESAENMNNVKSKKYSAGPNKIEQNSVSSENFRTLFNFHRIERSKKKTLDTLDSYDQKNMLPKRENYIKTLTLVKKHWF